MSFCHLPVLFKKGSFLFFLFLVPMFSVKAQTDSTQTSLTSPQSILKDRLFLPCPAATRSEPRPHNLMGNPPSPEQETRLIIDDGKKRLVIFAEEMNALGTHNLIEDIKNSYTAEEKPDYTFYESRSADGLAEVYTIPLKHDTTKDAILITSLIIQTKDSALIQIGAYLNPAAFRDLPAYQDLVKNILHAVRSGTRSLPYKARKEALPLFGNLSNLLFPCPDNFIVNTEQGYDFNVTQIRRLPPITYKVSGGIVIYSGRHPSLMAPEYQFKPEQAKEKSGLFLKTKIKWAVYTDKKRKICLQETIYDAPAPNTGLKIHLALVAASEKELAELLKIVENMGLKTLGE
jgi:hypothetical protein